MRFRTRAWPMLAVLVLPACELVGGIDDKSYVPSEATVSTGAGAASGASTSTGEPTTGVGGASTGAGGGDGGGGAAASSGTGGEAGGSGAGPPACAADPIEDTCVPDCEADFDFDACNCGSCGHSCFGGDCVDGRCVPRVMPVPKTLQQGDPGCAGAIGSLSCNGASLFVTTDLVGRVYRISLDLDPTAEAIGLATPMPHFTSASCDAVYFTDYDAGSAPRGVALAGGQTFPLDESSSLVGRWMAATEERVFWTEGGILPGRLRMWTRTSPDDPTLGETETLLQSSDWYFGVAADATHVFVSLFDDLDDLGTIRRIDYRTDENDLFLADGGGSYFVTDATDLYWLADRDDGVRRKAKDSADPDDPGVVYSVTPLGRGLALDDTFVYWLSDKEVFYAAKDDPSSGQLLYSFFDYPTNVIGEALAVCGDFVFVASEVDGCGSVLRLPRATVPR